MTAPRVRVGYGILAALATAVVAVSCGDATGPARPVQGTLGVTPRFANAAAAARIDIASIRFLLRRSTDSSLAKDTTIAVSADADSVELVLTVPITQESETFELRLELFDPSGAIVFRGGPVTVTPSTTGEPVQVPVTLVYTGTGFDAAGVLILTQGAALLTGQRVRLAAIAVDSAGDSIPGTPIIWSSLDTAVAGVPDADSSEVVGGTQRGTARIVAELFTGQADTTMVMVQPVPSAIAADSGASQSDTVDATLPLPLVARVTGGDGQGVSGIWIRFAETAGGGTLSVDSALSDAQGRARTAWTLGPLAGTQTVTASVAGLGPTATFDATALAGTPAAIAVAAGDGQTAIAGTEVAILPAVDVTDANGNPVPGISVFFEVTSGGGSVSGVLPTTNAAGVATLASWQLGPTIGTNTLRARVITAAPPTAATAAGDTSPRRTGRTRVDDGTPAADSVASGPPGAAIQRPDTLDAVFTAEAVAGQATTLTLVSGNGQAGTVGVQMPESLVIAATDAGGNPTAGAAVAWTVTGGGGSVSADTVLTDSAGMGLVFWTLGGAAGTQTVIATLPGGADTVAFTATANPGAPAQLALVTQPTDANAAAVITPAVDIEVRDSFGNTVTADNATIVTIGIQAGTGTAGALLSGTTGQTVTAGAASFADLAVDSAGTGFRLEATATGLTAAVSDTFAVLAGPPASLTLTPDTLNFAALGATAPLTAVVRDAGGNELASAVSWVSLAPGIASVGPTGIVTAVTNGTTSVTATAGGVADTSTVIVSQVATQLAFTTQPSATVALATITPAPEVAALDSLGSVVTTFTDTISVAIGTNPAGGTLSGVTDVTAGAGTAQFTGLSIDAAGSGYTLVATSAGLQPDTSVAFDVTAAAGIRWINTSGGTWSVGTNWSTGTVPTSSDSVIIDQAGTYTITLDVPVTVPRITLAASSGTQTVDLAGQTLTITTGAVFGPTGALILPSGTLTGAGLVEVQGTLTWTGGTMGGTGTTRVAAGATGLIDGTGGKTLTTRRFENAGTVTHSLTGDLSIGNGAAAVNEPTGVWTMQTAGGDLLFGGGAGAVFENLGQFQATSGGSSIIGIQVANRAGAAFDVLGGTTLSLTAGTDTLDGTVTLAPNSFLAFAGANGFLPDGVVVTGTGFLQQITGTVTVGAAATDSVFLPRFEKTAGSLVGPGVLVLTDSLAWSGGTMGGTGTTVVLDTVTATFSTSSAKLLDQRRFENFGTVLHSGSGDLSVSTGGRFANQATGVYELQTAGGDVVAGGGAAVFENLGTYRVSSGGQNQQQIQLSHQAGALLDLTAGSRLDLTAGVDTLAGAVTLAAGADLRVTGGGVSLLLPDGFTFTGAGFVRQITGTVTVGEAATDSVFLPRFEKTAGSLVGPGVLVLTDSLAWSGGTMGGTGTTVVLDTVTATFSTSSAKLLDQRRFENFGTVLHSGSGDLSVSTAGRFTNQATGVYELQTAGGDVVAGGGAAVFENLGTYRVSSGGLNQHHIQLSHAGGALLDLTAGSELRLTAGVDTLAGAVTLAGGADLSLTGGAVTVLLPAGFSITGAGFLRQSAGTLTVGEAAADSAFLPRYSKTGGLTDGPGVLVLTDSLEWGGGTMGDTGVTTVLDTVTATFIGSGAKILSARRFENFGTILHSGLGDFNIQTAGVFRNQASGIYEAQTAGGDLVFGGGGGALVENLGTYRVNSGGLNQLQVQLTHAVGALLDLTAGSDLNLVGGIDTLAGLVTLAAGSDLSITGSGVAVLLPDGFSFTGAGQLRQTAGTLTIGEAAADTAFLPRFTKVAGTTDGPGILVLTDSLAWTGGTMGGTGTTVVLDTVTATFSSSGAKVLDTRRFENFGTVLHSGLGDLNISTGARFVVEASGVYEAQTGGGDIVFGGGGSAFVDLLGTYRVTSGSLNQSQVQVAQAAGGLVDVQSASTLRLTAGADTLAGAVTLGAGSLLDLNGSGLTMFLPAGFAPTGTGAFRQATGTLTVGAAATDSAFIPFFEQTGGTTTGPGVLVVTDTLSWTTGTWSGTGVTTIRDTVNATFTGSAGKALDTRTIDNFGTVLRINAGDLSMANASLFINRPSAVFEVQTAGGDVNSGGGAASQFNNLGTYRKTVGGTNTHGIPMVTGSTSTLDIVTGTMNVSGAFTDSAGAVIQGGGTLNLTGAITGGSLLSNLAPGTSPGQLTFTGQALPQGGAASLTVELAGAPAGGAGTAYDQLVLTAGGILSGNMVVDTLMFVPSPGDVFPVVVATGGTMDVSALTPTFPATGSIALDTAISAGGDTLFIVASGAPPGPPGTEAAWTGATSTDWGTASNWDPAAVPTVTENVYIPTGTPFAPTISANQSVDSLLIDPGVTVTITTGDTLFVDGDLDASFTSITGGTVRMTGTGMTARGSVGNFDVTGTVTVVDSLLVTGNARVTGAGADLDLGGRRMVVADTFFTAADATLSMSSAADTLDVGLAFLFDGASTVGLLLDGTLIARGDFTQLATTSTSSFAADGPHTTVFVSDGGTHTINLATPGTIGLAHFAQLENLPGTGGQTIVLASQVPAHGPITFTDNSATTASGVAGSGSLFSDADIAVTSSGTGISVSPSSAILGGTLSVSGTNAVWTPGETEFNGAGQTIPMSANFLYNTIRVSGTATLGATGTTLGDVRVSGGGNLTILGDTLSTTNFFTETGGTLTMGTAAGLLVTTAAAQFGGGSTAGLLTAGKLLVQGSFTQVVGTGAGAEFAPGTGYELEMGSALTQNISLASPGTSVLGGLLVSGLDVTPLTGFTAAGTATITGVLDVPAAVTATFTGAFDHQDGAILQGDGTVDVSGAGPVTFAGDIRPGTSPGTFSITGAPTQAATANWIFELDGTVAGTAFDVLNVSGTPTLNGAIDIVTSFTPADGDLFMIMNTGGFPTVNGTYTGLDLGGMTLDALEGSGGIELIASPTIVFSGDSTFAARDGILRASFGADVQAQSATNGEVAGTPRFNPARTHIAYTDPDAGTGESFVWIVTPDGSTNLRIVADSSFRRPRFNSTGTRLAFECGDGFFTQDICAIDVSGGFSTDMGNGFDKYISDSAATVAAAYTNGPPSFAWNPAVADQIMFARDSVLSGDTTTAFFLSDWDGNNVSLLRKLPDGLHAVGTMDWNPGLDQVVFAARVSGTTDTHIYIMDADGLSAPTQLTMGTVADFNPIFDRFVATTVLFVRDAGTSHTLFTVPVGGGGTSQVTPTLPFSRGFQNYDYSPDGSFIVLVDQDDGTWGTGNRVIVKINDTTTSSFFTDQRTLVGRMGDASTVFDSTPTWRP